MESWLSGQKQQTVNLPGHALRRFESSTLHHAGVTQLVESQPSKLLVAGSNPVSRSKRESLQQYSSSKPS